MSCQCIGSGGSKTARGNAVGKGRTEESGLEGTYMGAPDRENLTEQTFPSNLDQLVGISSFVMDSARRVGMNEQGLFAVQMAVDEAATNVIVHGYQERGVTGTLRILCWAEGSIFFVQLRDHSPPFDPGEVPDPDLQAPLEDRKEGGLGIYLMRRLMDRVGFSREGDENVLTMARHFVASGTAPDVAVVSLEGRIDATRSAYMERTLRAPLKSGQGFVVVDLSQVSYLSSSGLRALLVLAKELRERGGCLALCCARPGVTQVLRITGFTDIIPLYETRDAALHALEGSCEPGS